MHSTTAKPKLVFFQNKYDEGLPEFLLAHKQEHVDCLSVFFDVTVIHDDCDYAQVCDIYHPDLALFESGVNLLTCRRPKITNVRDCQRIPKLGFLNADAWCETRSGSLAEMDYWGVDAIFSISATAPEHMPAVADRLFVWPNFVDPDVYRDYGEAKLIPVLLSGATAAQYPWRRRVYKLISQHYPSLSCPHQGYLSRSSTGQVLHGERYARTINASRLSPVCGTVAREVVRKHFEIPGCNTCLITERAQFLEDAGFVDMVNCVFADEHDILDKLEVLFRDPERLESITTAGHRLVHSRHTLRHRDQIWQWFKLNQELKPNEKIVQSSPFLPLNITGKANESTRTVPLSVGIHLRLLQEGDEKLWADQIDVAEAKYRRCLSYMNKLPEARFKLALCKLYRGHAAEANEAIFELIQYCISEYKAPDPDPVEWAYYILSLLCMNKVSEAKACALEFPWLEHPELESVRRVMQALDDTNVSRRAAAAFAIKGRASIHNLPERSEVAWREKLYRTLRACDQTALVDRIRECEQKSQSAGLKSPTEGRTWRMSSESGDVDEAAENRLISRALDLLKLGSLDRRFIHYKVRRKLRNIRAEMAARFSGRDETPVRNGELCRVIRELSRDMEVGTALICGAGIEQDVASAVLAGTAGGERVPQIFCLSDLPTSPHAASEPPSNHGQVKRVPSTTTSTREACAQSLENAIQGIKRASMIDLFDAVVIDWSEAKYRMVHSCALRQELRDARLVVIGSLENGSNREIYAQMLNDHNHVLLDRDAVGDRYVVLKKRAAAKLQLGAAPVPASIYLE